MTIQEREIMGYLVLAHNEFVKLPTQHTDDLPEWVSRIHDLQRIIMARESVRNNPDVFKKPE
jgi:hypothetical protein